MRLPPDWLPHFLDQALYSALERRPPGERLSPPRLRRQVRVVVHRRGLVYGAPLLPEGRALSDELLPLWPVLRFLDALGEVAALVGAVRDEDPEHARRALLASLAALYVGPAAVEGLHQPGDSRLYERAMVQLGAGLRRHRYLAGDPLVGLTLHHALVAVDAAACLELIGAYHDEPFPPGLLEGVLARREQEHEGLVGAIGRLSRLRNNVDEEVRRGAVTWHLKKLGFPRRRTQALLKLAREQGEPEALCAGVPEASRERHLLQLMMVARIDGRVSAEEQAFLAAVAAHLAIPPERAALMLARVERFCTENRKRIDPLALAAAFELDGGPIPSRLLRYLRTNAQGVWQEIRETGDLAVLLAKRSRGAPLTDEEAARMRAQLLDVARVLPGLAVLTLPGGTFLLPVLFKILPFDLRPSAFREQAFEAFAQKQREAGLAEATDAEDEKREATDVSLAETREGGVDAR